jgi:hypothetical protein
MRNEIIHIVAYDNYSGFLPMSSFGLLNGVSLAFSAYVRKNKWQLGSKCITIGYNTFNYMKCGLQIMLDV